MSHGPDAVKAGEAGDRAPPQLSQEDLAEKIESARLPRGPYGLYILLLCGVTPFLTFAISYDVVVRYLFNDTLLWVNDITGYLLAALAFLGGAYVMSQDAHTRVDILVSHAGATVRRWLTFIDAVLVLLVCAVLAVASGYSVWDSYSRNVSVVGIIQVPRWLVLAPIFIGTVLISIERIRFIRVLLQRWKDAGGLPVSGEAPRV